MTASQARRLERISNTLVRLSAPKLREEPRPEQKVTPTLVCRDNVKRTWSF